MNHERPRDRGAHRQIPSDGESRAMNISLSGGGVFGERTTALACLTGLTLLLGAAVWRSHTPPRPSSESDRLVTPEVLAQALSSDVPERLTMSDDLEFFRMRLQERGPDDVLALQRLASASLLRFQTYGREADLARAEKHLVTLTDRYPTSSSLWATVASARLSRHDFPGAVQAAERSVRVGGPDDEGGRLRLFDAYLATGQYEEAHDLLSLPLDRDSFAYRTRAVRLKDRLGDVVGARNDMEAALAVARSYAQPPAIVAWCLVELGRLEHHSGRPYRAVSNYREALELLPGSPAAIEGLAQVALGSDRDLRAAEALFLKALENGAHLDVYVRLIEMAEGAGWGDRVVRYRQRFLAAVREDSATEKLHLRSLALVLGKQDETLAEALRYAKRDLAIRHTSESFAVLGWVLSRLGRERGAWMWIEAAQTGVQPEPEVDYLSGLVAFDTGRPERGRQFWSRALRAEAEIGPIKSEAIRARLGARRLPNASG